MRLTLDHFIINVIATIGLDVKLKDGITKLSVNSLDNWSGCYDCWLLRDSLLSKMLLLQ